MGFFCGVDGGCFGDELWVGGAVAERLVESA